MFARPNVYACGHTSYPSCGPGYAFVPSCGFDHQRIYEQRRREASLRARHQEIDKRERAERLALLRAQAVRREREELARRRAEEDAQLQSAYGAAIAPEATRRWARAAQAERYEPIRVCVHVAAPSNQQQLNKAAVVVQRAFRARLTSRGKHTELNRVAADFASLQSFVHPKPTSLVLAADGTLAFTPANASLRAHEEGLTRLLVRLDAVSSAGDEKVRAHRRALAQAIEDALERIEALKASAQSASSSATEQPAKQPSSVPVSNVVAPSQPDPEARSTIVPIDFDDAESPAAELVAEKELALAVTADEAMAVDGADGADEHEQVADKLAAMTPTVRSPSPSLHSVNSDEGEPVEGYVVVE